jgi:membrane-bound lytic murein transglycosylase B
MKLLTLVLFAFSAVNAAAAVRPTVKHKPLKISPTVEQQREVELQKKLCADKELNCEYITSLFLDPRFALTVPPPPTPPPPPVEVLPKDHERNPYLTRRFGLLTPESLERGRQFITAHALAFDAAQTIYGVNKEVICGHLRIETDFGIATPKTQHPLGTAPAFNRLVTLYVHHNTTHNRQKFALIQLKDLIRAAQVNHWDLFEIPGSSTGAIGLLQFEPENFNIAVDGDGDGTIDLFSGDDAIMSLAHFLVTHGWDNKPEHQEKAIYSYYGKDPRKYYMKAVLAYAAAESAYLKDHPVERKLNLPQPLEIENQVSPSNVGDTDEDLRVNGR